MDGPFFDQIFQLAFFLPFDGISYVYLLYWTDREVLDGWLNQVEQDGSTTPPDAVESKQATIKEIIDEHAFE